MKIKNLLFLSLCLFVKQVSAQTGEPVELSVIYQFVHINDLNKPDKPFEQEMVLSLGKTESSYHNWTINVKAKTPPKQVSSASKPVTKGAVYSFVPTVFIDSKGVQDYDLLQYPALNKLTKIVMLGASMYRIETTLPKIDWKVYQEKKQIGGYSCQKAVGSYAGRTYTAWFAAELPFSSGPWKLSGLPGLILEAKDATGQVAFLFKEFNKESGKTTAPKTSRSVKVSESAYQRAYEAFDKDPVALYQSQLPIGTDKAELVFKDDSGISYYGEEGKKLYDAYKKDLKRRKNNPLELKK
ncbi:MAG: GLPGLI family protein [Bacteroidota bacterium]